MIFLNNYNVYKHTFPDGKIYIGVLDETSDLYFENVKSILEAVKER